MSSPKDSSAKKKESVAAEADRIVAGDRQSDYGHPYDSYTMFSDLLNALGFRRLAKAEDGWGVQHLTVKDMSVVMRMLKECRLFNTPGHRDSLVDICGYAKVEEMIWNRINGGS